MKRVFLTYARLKLKMGHMTSVGGVPGAGTQAAAGKHGATGTHGTTGRVNQRLRTRTAIVDATRRLARSGAEISMPLVAREALVSEATAYRYFPDLASLLREADEGSWPAPAEALAPVAGSDDPVERVAYAAEFLLRGVLSNQGAVRAMIAASITKRRRPWNARATGSG